MNKNPWGGLDNLISSVLTNINIYLEATEDNKIKIHLSNDRPANSSLACSIKEFIDNGWSMMEKKQ